MRYDFRKVDDPVANGLGDAYSSFSENFTRLEAFGIVAAAGIEAGLPAVEKTFRESIDGLLADYAGRLTPEEFEVAITRTLRDRKRLDTALAIRAATVVFAHAILERFLHDLLDMLCAARPSEIADQVPERKCSVRDLRSKPIGEVISEVAGNYIEGLKRDTLEKKLSLIFNVCGFIPECQKAKYRFDKERLLSIDALRQALLHRHIFGAREASPDIDLAFVQDTAFFLLCTVSRHLDSPINLWNVVAPFMPGAGSA